MARPPDNGDNRRARLEDELDQIRLRLKELQQRRYSGGLGSSEHGEYAALCEREVELLDELRDSDPD